MPTTQEFHSATAYQRNITFLDLQLFVNLLFVF